MNYDVLVWRYEFNLSFFFSEISISRTQDWNISSLQYIKSIGIIDFAQNYIWTANHMRSELKTFQPCIEL